MTDALLFLNDFHFDVSTADSAADVSRRLARAVRTVFKKQKVAEVIKEN